METLVENGAAQEEPLSNMQLEPASNESVDPADILGFSRKRDGRFQEGGPRRWPKDAELRVVEEYSRLMISQNGGSLRKKQWVELRDHVNAARPEWNFSLVQIRDKIQNLKKMFREARENGPEGTEVGRFFKQKHGPEHFEMLERLLDDCRRGNIMSGSEGDTDFARLSQGRGGVEVVAGDAGRLLELGLPNDTGISQGFLGPGGHQARSGTNLVEGVPDIGLELHGTASQAYELGLRVDLGLGDKVTAMVVPDTPAKRGSSDVIENGTGAEAPSTAGALVTVHNGQRQSSKESFPAREVGKPFEGCQKGMPHSLTNGTFPVGNSAEVLQWPAAQHAASALQAAQILAQAASGRTIERGRNGAHNADMAAIAQALERMQAAQLQQLTEEREHKRTMLEMRLKYKLEIAKLRATTGFSEKRRRKKPKRDGGGDSCSSSSSDDSREVE